MHIAAANTPTPAFPDDAGAELWNEHLARVLAPDDQAFLARLVGYGMLSAPLGKVRVICLGNGANGKTTTLRAIRETLGSYASIVGLGTLRISKGSAGAVHFTEHNSLPLGSARSTIDWRTFVLPFDVTITEAERDRARLETLGAQAGEAILNWAMEGVGDYLIRGDLAPPANVARLTQSYLDGLAARRRSRAA